MKLIKEREKAKLLFRVHEGLLVLTSQMTISRKLNVENRREKIDYLDLKELRKFISDVKTDISNMRNYYGVKVPNSYIVDVIESIELVSKRKICFIAKFKLKEIFKNYHKVIIDFDDLPEHSKIGIDLGFVREKPEGEHFILEAAIFEDMCSIFNLLKERLIKNDKVNKNKVDKKKNIALMRSAVLTVFNFVEAYLNGIAADYFFTNFANLDDKTKIILTEWDHIKNRPEYLSLKNKAQKYICIACNTTFLPLQETNCEELAFILEKTKAIRDSIVHPSSIHGLGFKEEELLKLQIDEVEKIIDVSIKLVKKIEKLIYGNEGRIRWLFERDKNGYFPEQAFY
jgi:hypothetical protein